MQKILIIISEYFSRFFSVVLVGGALLLVSTFITIPDLWMGSGRSGNIFHNNFGSILLENFESNYMWFFFFPFLYFLALFFIISVFIWIYYRNNKKIGTIGFKNVILSLLVVFVIVYLPIRISDFRFKVSQMKADELANYKTVTKISSLSERRELLNIYHSLYQEGLLVWRHNPIEVVKHDLTYGVLRPYDGEKNILKVKAITSATPGILGNAVVSLNNEKNQVDIYLNSQGSEDDRVWMVYGYEFDKKQKINNFGNDKIEEAITNYLLTEKHFSWKNRDDSHNFCFIENLKSDNELFPLYIWAYCGEYVIERGELKTVSGSSGPAKINYPNELSYYDLSKFSYEAPGDGSNYSKDVKRIFPEEVQKKIFNHSIDDLIIRIEDYAFTNISNWNSIKQAIEDCEIDTIVQAHSLDVVADFKNGKTITAREPKIDDIFDIVYKYKDKCGEIKMITE